jgi:hypothetical protein
VSLLAVAGLIACNDASLFDTFSCPWTPPTTFYKLLEIERRRQLMKVAQELKEAHISRQVGFAEAPKHPQVRLE